MNNQQAENKNILVKWLDEFIDKFLEAKTDEIKIYIDDLFLKNSNISKIKFAKKLINKKSINNGIIGAATGVGGFMTLPITVPTDLIITWKIQIALIYSIAYVFGYSDDKISMKTDIYLILGGKQAKNTLNELGINTGNQITKKALQKHIFREISGRVLRIIPQKIIAKASEKSVSHFVKLVPLAGAPFGFAFDFFDTRIVGRNAIRYFNS